MRPGARWKRSRSITRAKLRRRQGVISPHQIPDFKSAVLADGLQRRDHMSNAAAFRERQQQPLIGDNSPIDVIDVGDGVDGKAAVACTHGRSASRWVPVWARDIRRDTGPCRCGRRRSTSACRRCSIVRSGGGSRGLDGIVHQVRKFIGEPRGLVFLDAWQPLRRGHKSRSHVFSRSRCLIDLTTDGLALSNSKAAIRSRWQNTNTIGPRAKIFYESPRSHPNTVNDGFPGRPNGPAEKAGQIDSIVCRCAFD